MIIEGRMKKSIFVFAFFVILIGGVLASPYQISDPKFTEGTRYSSFKGVYESGSEFSPDMCQEGQDFIVQIDPLGCSPSVVRSDLLEEQDVPVFCELRAIKINPLINIESIDSINFAGSDYPPEVRTIGFHHSYDALGANRKLNNMMWDKIGYATIILDRQPNESALTNCEKSNFGGEVCWVEGNLSARITYDLEGGFGLRQHTFYLPVMDDKEYSRKLGQYEFFDGRGYIRAEDVSEDGATIGVYSGLLQNPYREGAYEKQAYQKYNLEVGKSSSKVLLPGLDCLSAVRFNLDSIDYADTRVKLRINSKVVEVREGEPFLDGNCRVRDLTKNGLNQKVEVVCDTDDGRDSFNLEISPSVTLNVNGEDDSFVLGEKIAETDDGANGVYLAKVVLNGNREENVSAYFVELKVDKDKLSSDDLRIASSLVENYQRDPEVFLDYVKSFSSSLGELGYFLFTGAKIYSIDYGEDLEVGENKIKILGFGDNVDLELNNEVKEPLSSANEDYDLVYDSYSGEKYPSSDLNTLDERSLYQKIKLNFELGQKKQASIYCDEFKEFFPDSNLDLSECNDFIKIANKEVETHDVVVRSEVKEIVLEGINEPSYEEYGAEVLIRYRDSEETRIAPLRKSKPYFMNPEKNEFIQLEEVGEDYAKIKISAEKRGLKEGVVSVFTESRIIKIDEVESFGSDYVFTLRKTNLERVAKVTVHPSVDYAGTNVDFPFKIGIEKRSIQLSPEKTESLVNSLNDTIEKWEGISNNLESVVEGMKKACLATGAVLTAKNVLFGSGGETIARQEVMRGENGWNERCKLAVSNGEYRTVEQCFYERSNEIDSEVEQILSVMKSQNNYIKNNQGTEKEGLLGERVADTEKLANTFSSDVNSRLSGGELSNPDREKEFVSVDVVKKALADEKSFEDGIYSIDNLKEIDLYSKLSNQYPNNEAYEKRLFTALKQVEQNYEDVVSIREAEESVVSIGLEGMSFRPRNREDRKDEYYEGYTSQQQIGKINPGKNIQGVSVGGREYLLTLKDLGNNKYRVDGVYNTEGEYVSNNQSVLSSYGEFVKIDSSSYGNKIIDPELKFYETEPYKGLPALVPVDTEDGWYAYVKQTVPALGNVNTYDESGRINSFYLCNVGENGLAEFNSKSVGDDVCQMINLAGAYTNNFPGLSENELSKLVDESVRAIYEASRAYGEEGRKVSILGQSVRVGEPALNLPASQCADYMSPKDCQIMFNVCDPVICPSSRCDFGGAYPVNDVIQSGIIGSLALCLPNVNEGIYVPVCLSGVNAGIDGLLSVFGSYRDCLEQSLETGETVGVCDEIHSVYLCEFFWRQGLPLAKIAVPKIISSFSGENVRGGGEYSGVQAAFANAQDSVSFFVENYAVNANKAFKARSQEQVGTEVCKNFISGSYPNGQGALDVLTEADSPHQFTANFDEIPFSSTTNPPTSHYKVYYHIYAGNDRGAYFRVYLRGGTSSSYYQDTGVGRQVASGYIGTGEYASETADFTAPSNYKELCVQVNEQTECGFKQVSTNFAQNYVKDQYMERLAGETDVKTEKECVSGSADAGGLLNLNIQEGVSNAIDPDLYNRGIIRTCATDNPGAGKDPYYGTKNQRWKEVGYCGDESVKCWIDTETIDDSMEFETSANQTLEGLTEDYLDNFAKDNNYFTDEEFSVEVEEVESIENPEERISRINPLFEKLFMNNHKAYLFFLRGNAYGEIAKEMFRLSGPCAREDEYLQLISFSSEKKTITEDDLTKAYSLVVRDKCLVDASTEDGENLLHFITGVFEPSVEMELVENLMELGMDVDQPNVNGITPFMLAAQHSSLEVVKYMYENSEIEITQIDDLGRGPLDYAKDNPDTRVFDYLSEIFNYYTDEMTSADYVSQQIEFADGKIGANLCYKYFEEDWHWTDDCFNVGTEKIKYGPEGKVVVSREFVEWKSISEADEASRLRDRRFIRSLDELGYKDGLESLLKRTYEGEDRGTFSNSDLVSAYTNFNHEKVFTFDSRTGVEQGMLFRFDENEKAWYWSYGNEDNSDSNTWIKTPSLEKHPIFSGAQKTEIEKKIIQILGDLEGGDVFMNGAMILFLSENKLMNLELGIYEESESVEGGDSSIGELKAVFDSFMQKEVDEEACREADLAAGGEGLVHCFSAMQVVYNDYSGYEGMRCIYSAVDGQRFTPQGKSVVVGPSGDKNSDGEVKFVTSQSCSRDLSEQEKLDLLKPGYQFDFIVFGGSPHSGVFWNWTDRSENEALIFEWGAMSGDFRTYDYVEVDLSDDVNPVYRISEVILEENVEIGKEEDSEDTLESLDLTKYSEQDRELFQVVEDCSECGDGGGLFSGYCDEKECLAIGEITGKNCVFENSFLGGNCVEEMDYVERSCNSRKECQQLIGNDIFEMASELNDEFVVRDSVIQDELDVKSFECLALMVAMKESSLTFCDPLQEDGDPFYCEGDLNNVVGGKSKGTMQLNMDYIDELGGYESDDMIYFDQNVKAGLERLKKNYEAGPKSTKNAETFNCGSFSRDYYGWKYALRRYNGWACSDSISYVEDVLDLEDYVVELFPMCEYEGEKTLSQLRGAQWTLESAYEGAQMLEGSLDDNLDFVDQIFSDEVINQAEYDLIVQERSLEFLEKLLKDNLEGY